MMKALVVLEGSLGDTVAHTLEGAELRFRTERLTSGDAAPATSRPADLIVVDEAMDDNERTRLTSRHGAPIIVIGRDVGKPLGEQALRNAVVRATRCARSDTGGLVAVDPPLQQALHTVDQVAKRGGSVLITGPTGSGKELLARHVHLRSGRQGAFVAVNCAAFSDGLAESALFGHVRGAFTGAVSNAGGAFVEAHRGTLFLDEIGELDPGVQAKLLRALEEGSIRAVGASKPTAIDVRVVAATNRDLRKEIAMSRFRSDLYFRIATFVVEVPPLRDRPGDRDALITRFHAQHDRGSRISFSREARHALDRYPWPGNVRELRNVMERVLSLAAPGELTEAALLDLAPELATAHAVPAEAPRRKDAILTSVRPTAGKTSAREAAALIEQQLIRERLARGGTQLQKLADELGIHRTTLWRKLKRLQLTPGNHEAPQEGQRSE
ncbi:sigma 54-interacting transcriptional regulator [Pendulispora albinea]|uniref:Sigma 54-interacting transcriptional regulator n=1 Tax=Pendulispora albinea TaxID=2741071 RepID=A0ABZ2LTP4_9BACT